MPVRERLYTASLRWTGVKEYGFSLQDLNNGAAVPPSGARFDIAFEGRLEGEKINGAITGVDFGEVRADGRFDLNIQANITTDDGETIALSADGIFADVDPATGTGQVRENVKLTTASPAYGWVNQLQIWVTGTANVHRGEILLQGYVA
jgi:hypothetical protein